MFPIYKRPSLATTASAKPASAELAAVDSDAEIDVISVGEESCREEMTAAAAGYKQSLLDSAAFSQLGSPASGSAGSACCSPPMKNRLPPTMRYPQGIPPPHHAALKLPNVLPFLAYKHQEEAMMAAIVRQSLLQSCAAMSTLMAPKFGNPFLLPFMPCHIAQSNQMKPMNNIPGQRLGPTRPALVPPTPNHRFQQAPGVPSFVSQRSPTASDKLETVNGGFGIKNPLAKNPAIQEHLLQTMVEKGEENFVCKVCKKKFPLQRLLNRHVKCHSAIKRYLCTFCGKGFNDTFDLKRHTRTHTGVRPYRCSLCNKAFTQRCSLESHCKKVHNEEYYYQFKQRRSKLYVCEQCGSVTDDPEKHFLHLKDFHPGSPALQKCYDKRQFKFSKEQLPRILQHHTEK